MENISFCPHFRFNSYYTSERGPAIFSCGISRLGQEDFKSGRVEQLEQICDKNDRTKQTLMQMPKPKVWASNSIISLYDSLSAIVEGIYMSYIWKPDNGTKQKHWTMAWSNKSRTDNWRRYHSAPCPAKRQGAEWFVEKWNTHMVALYYLSSNTSIMAPGGEIIHVGKN